MKKLVFVCMILVMLCFIGCDQAEQQNSAPEEQTQPTIQTTVPEPTQCNHEDLLATFIRYEYPNEYGGTCEDPTHVYNKCRDCGEFIYVGDEPSELECISYSYDHTVIKEATCTEEGAYTFECSNCLKVREKTIPSKGHAYYWFWGEEGLRCPGCGLLQDLCNHEYELTFTTEPRGKFPGERFYECKNCGKEKKEYFDKYGDYDLRAVKDAVTVKLQALGFQVLEDYDITSSSHVYKAYDKIHCRDTNSKKAPQQLIELSDDVIHQLLYHNLLGEYGADPANYYAWVRVSYFSNDIASGFNITVYARGAFWKI